MSPLETNKRTLKWTCINHIIVFSTIEHFHRFENLMKAQSRLAQLGPGRVSMINYFNFYVRCHVSLLTPSPPPPLLLFLIYSGPLSRFSFLIIPIALAL